MTIGEMLRPYQQEAKDITATCFRYNKNVVLVMPTGSGKTRTGCVMALMSIAKGKKVDIMCHRDETATQFRDTLRALGHDPEMCVADNKSVNWDAPIMVCMVETYHRRKGQHGRTADFMIIDEAHRGEFRKVVDGFKGKVLGLTATPIAAASDNPLSSYFDACVNPIKSSWLVENGFLCKPEYYVTAMEGKRLKVERGEYTEQSQMLEFMAPKLYKGAMQQYLKLASDDKAICYNVNVKHSLDMLQQFQEAGIKCWHVDGKTPKEKRKQIFKEFSEYDGGCVLHNVGVATTGTDIPSVRCIILNRCTAQFALYHQMVGRGSRPIKGIKDTFKVIDMGGNSPRFKRLGVYGQDVDWQWLFSNPCGEYDGRKPKVMKKTCSRCAKPVGLRETVCGCCGYKFTKEECLKAAELTQDLVLMRQVAKDFLPRNLQGKSISDMSYRELVQYGEYMGYKKNWAGIQMGVRKERKNEAKKNLHAGGHRVHQKQQRHEGKGHQQAPESPSLFGELLP